MKHLQGASAPGAIGRRTRAVAVIGVPVLAFAGIFGSISATVAQSPAASSEPAASGAGNVTITLETYEDAATLDVFKAALAACGDPLGITVNVVDVPGSGAAIYPGKVRTELVGGSGPDLWRIWGGSLGGPFATQGFAQDLSSYYTQYGWNTLVPQGAIDGMTWNGTVYALPTYHGTVVAWYDKNAFQKAGITAPPTTYDELVAANDKLVAAGVVPLGTGGKYGWHIMRLFEYLLEKNAGPDLHDQLLAGTTSWDGNPAVIQSFTDLKTWADKGYLPQGVLGLDPSQEEPGFTTGKYAYTIAGAWVDGNILKSSDPSQFGEFVLPTGQTPERHSGFVEGWMINSKSPNQAAAAQIMNCMAQPDFVKAAQIGNSTVIAAKPDPTTDPLGAQNFDILNSQPFYTIQDQALPAEQANGYFDVQSKVIQGTMTPAEAATQMQAVMSTLQQ
jgi:raffinose/stachyose/melibiose transport system substrate-binding protein